MRCVPCWVAPNVLTLSGSLFLMTSSYTYFYYEPHLSGSYDSPWLYFYHMLSLFAYQTLDAIDGKHARNTKNSSPLGQLFDHGCDAVNSTIAIVSVAGICGLGTNWGCLYVIIMGQIIFYALNWKARHTGKFDFGQFSIDETLLLGQLILMVTAIKGPQFWNIEIFGISDAIIWIIFGSLTVCIIVQSFEALYEVNKHYKGVTSQEKRMFYNERFYELGNLFVFHLSLCLWNLSGIFGEYPVTFITICSFTFGHLIHRLIICDVTKQKSRRIQYIVIPFIFVGIISVFEYFNVKPIIIGISMTDWRIMYGIFCYTTFVMLFYAIRCMVDISNLLGIHIFFINAPKIKKED